MAVAYTVRDRLVGRWLRTVRDVPRDDVRVVAYMSAEFLTGSHLENHLLNLDLLERWSAAAARGETVNLTRDVSELALGIVLHALFSTDLERLVEAEGASPFDMLTRDSRR